MRRALLILAALFAALVGYLLFWPTGLTPEGWRPSPAPPLTGAYAKNDALAGVKAVALSLVGPESIAIDKDGRIHTGLADGSIVRLAADGTHIERLASTGGRPLGVELDALGRLVIADAERGLLRLEGTVLSVLAAEHEGKRFRFADDLAIAADGTIYFTDVSLRFGLDDYIMDLLDHRPTGRLFAWREGGKLEVVADRLYFANGVALAPDGSYALVAETSSYRVTRIWLHGERRGQREVFVDNLPGFPDNITWSSTRRAFWIALGAPRDATLDALAPFPFLRNVIARLPPQLRPKPRRHVFALAFDEQGKIIANLQHENIAAYAPLASVLESGGMLWLGSLERDGVGRIAAPALATP